MNLWKEYHRPSSVEEALSILASYSGQARLVSGGTDLLLEMQQGHKPPVEALVDVTGIHEMKQLRQLDQWIEVGASAPLSQIVESNLITRHATCLVESCGVIGGPQVRNVATLGGNVAHALPAADGTTALAALDAQAEIASETGRSWHPVLELFRGPGQSTIDQSREIITRFRFPISTTGIGTAFKRIMRPQGVALPILACAVWLHFDQNTIVDARICLGPVRSVPCRARKAEDALRGRVLNEGLAPAIAAAQAELTPRTSRHRATAEYRVEMIAVLLNRALPLAQTRALGGVIVPEGIGLQ